MLTIPMLFQVAVGAAPPPGGGLIDMLMLPVGIIILLYFLLNRSKNNRMKKHGEMLADDEVTIDTGSFSAFVIGALNAIVVVLFFLIWAGFSLPLYFSLGNSYGSNALALQVLVLAAGFVLSVCATGLIILILDIRRQLVAIRRSLSKR